MKKIDSLPRKDWIKLVEDKGFGYHSLDSIYWDESKYYSFTLNEVNEIEKATNELWEMCLEAVEHVIQNKLYDKFSIPEKFIPLIVESWDKDYPSIYGRFDFSFDKNNKPKMLEFNADTPTSLFEAAVIQWFWLKDTNDQKDQFNLIHEKLVNYWAYLKPYLNTGTLHFSCLKENLEDLTNVEYLRDTAIQAGLNTKLVYIEDIGWDENTFVDLENEKITNIFKLYPWEWMVNEDFGQNVILNGNNTLWIEPIWRMILSNKAILPILWELFPNHEYLLPAYFSLDDINNNKIKNYVKKPILSREGANVTIIKDDFIYQETSGDYGKEGYIYQEFCPLPEFGGSNVVIGSWVVGQESVGMGVRESNNLITNNTSRFVPHLIKD